MAAPRIVPEKSPFHSDIRSLRATGTLLLREGQDYLAPHSGIHRAGACGWWRLSARDCNLNLTKQAHYLLWRILLPSCHSRLLSPHLVQKKPGTPQGGCRDQPLLFAVFR